MHRKPNARPNHAQRMPNSSTTHAELPSPTLAHTTTLPHFADITTCMENLECNSWHISPGNHEFYSFNRVELQSSVLKNAPSPYQVCATQQ